MFDLTNHLMISELYQALVRGVKIFLLLDRTSYQASRMDVRNQIDTLSRHPNCHHGVADSEPQVGEHGEGATHFQKRLLFANTRPSMKVDPGRRPFL